MAQGSTTANAIAKAPCPGKPTETVQPYLGMVSDRNLAPGEWAVLALLCERPAHGWALARQLSPAGELGSIWSLTRPLVYRSLEILEERELIVPAGSEPGARGPNRTIFRATTCRP